MDKTLLLNLLEKYLKNTISNVERNQLKKLLREEKNKKIAEVFFEQEYRKQNENLDFSVEASFKRLLGRILSSERRKKVIPLYYKYAAAMLILFSLGIYLNNAYYSDSQSFSSMKGTDNRVTLTMEDGTKKILSPTLDDSITNTANQFLATVNQGVITYELTENKTKRKGTYNTLSVPYGNLFVVQLSDGTLVHMNSGSSLRYPVDFSDLTTREVFLEGEAYFDVTRNIDKKFVVTVNGLSVEVLGTQFNVSAYKDENTVETTLAKGAVRVVSYQTEDGPVDLKPNEQAIWNGAKKTFIKHEVDANDYTAWKNGILIFRSLDFESIEKKLERHYNVKITNTNQQLKGRRFTAQFEQKELEDILFYMSKIIDFEYAIKGNGVTIK